MDTLEHKYQAKPLKISPYFPSFQTMTNSKSNIFFSTLLLSLFLLSPPAFGDSNNAFLSYTCSSFDNYTTNTPYASNLQQAFYQLTSTAPASDLSVTIYKTKSTHWLYAAATSHPTIARTALPWQATRFNNNALIRKEHLYGMIFAF